MPEPPYGEIADLMKSGEVVPFLGAGVNFGMRKLHAGAGEKVVWDEKVKNFLPSGRELSEFLAHKINYPSKDTRDLADLAKVASYFVDASKRSRLRERLHEVFDYDFEPCEIHKYLAEVASPLLIVTTNYDDLTERAFAKAGRPFDLVVHPNDLRDAQGMILWWKHGADAPEKVLPNELQIDLGTTTVIYKMHGTVDRQKGLYDSYVITEEDYIDFLTRMAGQTAVPAQFMRHFRTRNFLFLGYGLNDWNLRVILNSLKSVLPDRGAGAASEEDDELHSWAIQYEPTDLEIRLWSKRDVDIYDVDIDEFVKNLRAQGA